MTTTESTIAILGTGVIGAPVARNLSRAGFTVRAWNRTRSKAEALVDDGVAVFDTPTEAVTGADVVLTALNDGPRVLAAIRAAAPGLKGNAIWVQHSTVGEDVAELAAYAAEIGVTFVDAPVQGTRQPAEQGTLIVMAAGPQRVRARLGPVFDTIGSRTVWVADDGASGVASRLKLVLNTWVVALTQGVGEALALADGLGVDPRYFVDIVSGGPTDNGYFQGKSAMIRSGDYTKSFSVDNAAKDTRLILAAAERAGIRMDTVEAGQRRLQRASAQGHGDDDMAAAYFASFDGGDDQPVAS